MGGVVRAAKADRNQPEIVQALRAAGAKVIHLHQLGAGIPDLLISTGSHRPSVGKLGLLEIKDGKRPPSERKLTQDQIAWWDEHKDIGPMAIANSVEEALAFLAQLRL